MTIRFSESNIFGVSAMKKVFFSMKNDIDSLIRVYDSWS